LLSAGATAGGAETRFDRFSGSFAISNGILANNDLKMTSSFINMTGRGHLDLGNQTIVFRIEPKASLGGRLHLLDIGVPFAITGSWRHLTYTPDVAGAVTGLVGAVLNTGTAPIEGLLGGLLGQPSDAPAPADKKKKKKTIGDTLGSMFGLH
ncbi:MAG TPA: AsmA-like C-terminal region-containing protein, partial [Rhizomicrobium sp.]